MTDQTHPRVADINARIAAGENLTDIDSQYLDMIGNGYSPEEADKLVPLSTAVIDNYIKQTADEPGELQRMLDNGHVPAFMHSIKHYVPQQAALDARAAEEVGSLAAMMRESLRLRQLAKNDPAARKAYLDHRLKLKGYLNIHVGDMGPVTDSVLTKDVRTHIGPMELSTKHMDPSEGVTPKISDGDWADLTIAEAESLVSSGKAIIRGGRLVDITSKAGDINPDAVRGMTRCKSAEALAQMEDDFLDLFSASRLMGEADAEIVFHTVKLTITTKWRRLRAKKGPRVMRNYKFPPKAAYHNVHRGKNRDYLPINQCGSRLYMMGSAAQGILTANDKILSKAREKTLESLGLTEEQMAERREVLGGKLGWVRKQVVGELDHPMTGRPVIATRNPLPLQMTARYTGHIQLEDRVRGTDKWTGKSIEGTVNSIAIHDGVETIIGIVTGDGTQYEAPLSEVTVLK